MKLFGRSNFFKNVVTLMSGAIIAQSLPLAVSPILSRLYTPADFGLLALFFSFASVFGAIATARYEMAILIPKSEKDAKAVVLLSFIIAVGISLILLIVIILFNHTISQWLGNEEISPWLYFVPLTVLGIGTYNTLSYYNNRQKDFKNIAQANVLKATTQVSANLGVHFIKTGAAGLIIGQVIAFWAGVFRLLKKIKNDFAEFKTLKKSEIKRVQKEYIDFPKFSMPSILANVLSQNLTNIITAVLFNSVTLGFYSFANRILGSPIAIIGQSIGQVYMNEAAEQRKKSGKATQIFNSTLKRLVLISIPIFVVSFFTLEDIFAFVFGEEWRIAGKYAIILLPLFLARFVAAPLSLTNIVFEKQKIALFWQVGLLTISMLIYLFIYLKKYNFETFLYIFSFSLFLYYVFLIFIVKKVANGKL